MSTIIKNALGEVIDTIQDYLNIDEMTEYVISLYKSQMEYFTEDKQQILESCGYDDEYIRERAAILVDKWNENMRDYLHQWDHEIYGNFNNVEYDYPKFRTGEYRYDSEMLNDMIARLDAGEQSEQASADRQFLTDWFWEAFGTFGVTYNFMDELCEQLYAFDFAMEEV